MSLLRRQFSIDNHLGRFKKALNYLHDLKAFEEVKTYVLKHGLYVEALELYQYQADQLVEIMRLYANHLQQSFKFVEAGIGTFLLMLSVFDLTHYLQRTNTCETTSPPANPTALPTSGENRSHAQTSFLFLNHSFSPWQTHLQTH